MTTTASVGMCPSWEAFTLGGDVDRANVGPIDMRHAILHLLDTEDGPMGSPTLMEALHRVEVTVSEPTVGRFLRRLDRDGNTERVSNLGRALTQKGRDSLAVLCAFDRQAHREQELLRAIRVTTPDDVLDVLVARRALEREIGRLAAFHATDEQIAALQNAIDHQRQNLRRTGMAVQDDIRFHALLAESARNRILAAALNVIRSDSEITMAIDAILKRTSGRYVVGHERILDAVRRHSPDDAEAAIVEHINRIIEDVRRFQHSAARVQRKET